MLIPLRGLEDAPVTLVTPAPWKEVAGVFLLPLLSCAGGAEGERDEWGEECRRQTSALGRRVGMLRALFPPPQDSARGGMSAWTWRGVGGYKHRGKGR